MMKRNGKITASLICLLSIFVFSLSSCSNASPSKEKEMNIAFRHDWKSNINLSYRSTNEIQNEKNLCKKYLAGINSVSGDDDFVTFNSLNRKIIDESTKLSEYTLNVNTRRVDKIKGVGEFDVSSFSNFAIEDSDRYNLLRRLANGTWSYTSSASFEGERGQISIARKASGINSFDVLNSKNENINDIEKLLKEYKYSKNTKVFVFRFVAIDEAITNIEKINMSFPGKILFYGGNDISLTKSNEVSISSKDVMCSIIRQESAEQAMRQCAYGFVILEQDTSPVTIGFIVAGSAILVFLVSFVFIYFYRSGKKYYERIYGNKNGK